MEEKEMMSFGEYLNGIKKVAPRTLELYLNYYRMIELDLLSNQEYVNAFIQDHKNNPVVRAMMLSALKFKGLHKTIELPDRSTGKKKKRLIRPISKDEIMLLSRGLHKRSFKEGLIFDLIYQGALRRVEIPTIRVCSFQWIAWLNNHESFCKLIVIGKGDKERTVFINPETAKSIIEFYMNKPNWNLQDFIYRQDFLFSTQNGDQLTEKIVYHLIKRGSMKYLGRDIRPHELRHARATELEKRGVQIKDIKNYLGHSSLATTEMYLHRSEEESLDAIREKME
jgi:site-specific recombinase XerD